jgi:hypothetical protein
VDLLVLVAASVEVLGEQSVVLRMAPRQVSGGRPGPSWAVPWGYRHGGVPQLLLQVERPQVLCLRDRQIHEKGKGQTKEPSHPVPDWFH